MPSEQDKMLAGELYDPLDPYLVQRRAIILPGVSIGAHAVIGAGSVVTRDVPAGVIAAGNPCRVVREIPE